MISSLFLFHAAFAGSPDPCEDNPERHERSASIQALFDQAESDDERKGRATGQAEVLKRDESRIKTLMKMDKKGHLCTKEDRWNAAWLYMQADDEATLQRGYDLALSAMNDRHNRGPWLVAFAYDRKRVASGHYQGYGTQTRTSHKGARCLIELEGNISDDKRKQHGVPSLQDIYRRTLEANGFPDDPPTLDRMRRRELMCKPVAFTKKAQQTIGRPD